MGGHDLCFFGNREDMRARIGMEALDEMGADFTGLYGRMKRVDHPYPDANLDVVGNIRLRGLRREEQLEAFKDRFHLRFFEVDLKIIHCTLTKEWPLFPTAILGLALRSFGGLAAQRSEDRQHNHHPKDSR